jgi:hypothetical protein
MRIGFWILFLVINIVWGYWHDWLRREEIRDKTFKALPHGWWFLFYMMLCCAPGAFGKQDWQLWVSLICLHGCVFPVAFNHWAEEPAFHLSRTTRSMYDRFQVWTGMKDAFVFNLGALLVSVGLLIWCIKKAHDL